ncbi:retrotransposon nucleocapsid protein [Cystoisospora suis]|uniref:Retrotransposon nucleocapsid protein n=1 Tax=Cystoisospora suis TaxID=483139 RepID=A0A2C6LB78_9APIC|nr:retrotransposon nucleocapsid protein [Cystoisospora suis]
MKANGWPSFTRSANGEPFIGTSLVTVETDHATLSRILQQKHVTSHFGYWLDKLADFNIKVVYKSGKQNMVADAISRRQDFAGFIQEQRTNQPFHIRDLTFWKEQYRRCNNFQTPYDIIQKLDSRVPRGNLIVYGQREYSWEDGYLCVRTEAGWSVCVPSGLLRKTILQQFHDHVSAGHPGVERTRVGIRGLFWWPSMDGDINTFVCSCVACARGKSSRLPSGGLLQPLPIPRAPWEDIAMDLIEGLPTTESGGDAIVTVVCRLTEMAQSVPTRQSATGEDLANTLTK